MKMRFYIIFMLVLGSYNIYSQLSPKHPAPGKRDLISPPFPKATIDSSFFKGLINPVVFPKENVAVGIPLPTVNAPSKSVSTSATKGASKTTSLKNLSNAKTNAATASSSLLLQQDSLSLVALYNSTNGVNWTYKTNWLSGDLSTWYGVTVSEGRVTQLYLNNNNLNGSIDATFNLSALKILYVYNNRLSSLNISQCPALEILYAYNNVLTQLVKNNTADFYSKLYDYKLYYNSLSSIDISNMPALKIGQFGLKPYDQTKGYEVNPNLTQFITNTTSNYYYQIETIGLNYNGITNLNLTGMENLQSLDVQYTSLASLDLTNHPKLRTISCNDSKIEILNISNNPVMELIYAYNNPLTQLIKNNTPDYYNKLYDLRVYYNLLSSVDISNMPALKVGIFGLKRLDPTKGYETNLNLTQFITNTTPNYYYQVENISVNFSAITACNLSGMGNLQYLDVQFSKITSIDLASVPKLKALICNDSKFTSLNISNNPVLEMLYAYNNLLTQFVKNNTSNYYSKLYDLRLYYNSLNGMDISNMPALKIGIFGLKPWNPTKGYEVNPSFTQLITNTTPNYYYQVENISLNFSGITTCNLIGMENLQYLDVQFSQLTTLDVTRFPKLKALICNDSKLASLNISNNPMIEMVYSYNNPLTQLITNNSPGYYSKLYDLRLQYNLLSSIDISNMPALKIGFFGVKPYNLAVSYEVNTNLTLLTTNTTPNYYSQIETISIAYSAIPSINLTGMGKLQTLYAHYSSLSSLDVLNSPALQTLYINNSKLTFKDLEPLATRTFPTYQYSPQANVDLFYSATTFTLSVQVGGVNNRYQWTKNGTTIPGATSPKLLLTQSDYAANASYQCIITNTLVTGLTLYSVAKHPQDQFTNLTLADFKSKTSGNWSDYTTWQIADGDTYLDAVEGEVPSAANSVYIEAGHAITLTDNASCKDLHLNTTADVVRLDTKEHVLEVWGKLRLYSGSSPGTNSMASGIPGWISTGTNGRIRLKGTGNRIITAKDEFTDHDNLKGWTLECSLNDGAIGTINSNFRAGNVIITSGKARGEE